MCEQSIESFIQRYSHFLLKIKGMSFESPSLAAKDFYLGMDDIKEVISNKQIYLKD